MDELERSPSMRGICITIEGGREDFELSLLRRMTVVSQTSDRGRREGSRLAEWRGGCPCLTVCMGVSMAARASEGAGFVFLSGL